MNRRRRREKVKSSSIEKKVESMGAIDDEKKDGRIRENMKSSSVEEIVRAILSQDDEKKEKLVYVFITSAETGKLQVVAFNPHQQKQVESSSSSSSSTDIFVDVTRKFKRGMPGDLKKIKSYRLAAMGSTIYFMGGLQKESANERDVWKAMSNKVFAFDTRSSEWLRTVAPMNSPRMSSTAVTYDNKIYVFGCYRLYRQYDDPLPPEEWAEFYDPKAGKAGKWYYLPGNPPRELLDAYQSLTPAVLEKQKICLLCIRYHAVYAYSFKDKQWLQRISDPAFTLEEGTCWNASVVALNNTLFWECYGRILAADYPSLAQTPVVKTTLPEAVEVFGEPGPAAYPCLETRLFDVGNGKLCLVYAYGVGFKDRENYVRFHTFELSGRSSSSRRVLVRPNLNEKFDVPPGGCSVRAIAAATPTERCHQMADPADAGYPAITPPALQH